MCIELLINITVHKIVKVKMLMVIYFLIIKKFKDMRKSLSRDPTK